jgi:hypothetical protein
MVYFPLQQGWSTQITVGNLSDLLHSDEQ